ncbi:MAG: hypothetical protein QW181_04670 [Candidatus Nitrosocaldus sp.]
MILVGVALAVTIASLSTNIHPLTNAKSIKGIIAKGDNIWNYYTTCDVDIQMNEIIPTALDARYPFNVRLAFPTYIPEGYKLVSVDWIINGPNTPNG